MALVAKFTDGCLEVYRDDVLLVYQPFKPSATGEQLTWSNEQEALDYFESIKSSYDVNMENIGE